MQCLAIDSNVSIITGVENAGQDRSSKLIFQKANTRITLPNLSQSPSQLSVAGSNSNRLLKVL